MSYSPLAWEGWKVLGVTNKVTDELKVFFEERVKVKVSSKTGPIVCIEEITIVLMDNIDIPAHQPHLKAENSRIGTIIRKDEFDSISVSCLYKLLLKKDKAALIDQTVAGKTFTKMGVETNFITAALLCTKSNWMEDHHR
jgi:hypothetical protein